MNVSTVFRLPGNPSILVLLLFLVSACTTMHPLDLPPGADGLSSSVSPGNVVAITTRSGERYEFKVTKVTANEIAGEDRVFRLEEIEKIEVRRATTSGKVAVVGGVFVGSVAFYILMFALIDVAAEFILGTMI